MKKGTKEYLLAENHRLTVENEDLKKRVAILNVDAADQLSQIKMLKEHVAAQQKKVEDIFDTVKKLEAYKKKNEASAKEASELFAQHYNEFIVLEDEHSALKIRLDHCVRQAYECFNEIGRLVAQRNALVRLLEQEYGADDKVLKTILDVGSVNVSEMYSAKLKREGKRKPFFKAVMTDDGMPNVKIAALVDEETLDDSVELLNELSKINDELQNSDGTSPELVRRAADIIEKVQRSKGYRFEWTGDHWKKAAGMADAIKTVIAAQYRVDMNPPSTSNATKTSSSPPDHERREG